MMFGYICNKIELTEKRGAYEKKYILLNTILFTVYTNGL